VRANKVTPSSSSRPRIASDSGRLRDGEPLRGAAEVQFLGQRGEVAQSAQLHGSDMA